MFHQGRGGLRHRVHPGNDHFIQNDRIERPQGGGGGGVEQHRNIIFFERVYRRQ
ncbi:DUF444 family protein [Salmonella enterica subsp. enterica serovar Anatum]|nr:DUF444 family protein [Salmonella enterica subsp. enterica serovar Anatum]